MSIWRYSDYISFVPEIHRVTLGEGNTPLILSRHIGPRVGMPNLWFKLESSNPTGSYKDRFAAAAISSMLWRGLRRCVATSSGNTGSALAAYCAMSQIDCRIAIVESAPEAKLYQMLAYGAHLARVRGFGISNEVTSRILTSLQSMTRSSDSSLQISAYCYAPEAMSGVQTIAYEIAEHLPKIEHVFCQAGGGGLTLAIARGFLKFAECRKINRVPAVHCVQPEGNNTIAGPLRDGNNKAQHVECSSHISGLQVPSVLDGNDTISYCRVTKGTGHLVTDEETWMMQKRLAREEGIFCEPAAAVSVAGALNAARSGNLNPESTIVCLITGSAFKDTATVQRMVADRYCSAIEPPVLKDWMMGNLE